MGNRGSREALLVAVRDLRKQPCPEELEESLATAECAFETCGNGEQSQEVHALCSPAEDAEEYMQDWNLHVPAVEEAHSESALCIADVAEEVDGLVPMDRNHVIQLKRSQMNQVQALLDQKALWIEGRMVLPGEDEQLLSRCREITALPEEKFKKSSVICKFQGLNNVKNFTSAESAEWSAVRKDEEDFYAFVDIVTSQMELPAAQNEQDFYAFVDEMEFQVVASSKHAIVATSIGNYSNGLACRVDTVEPDGAQDQYQEIIDESGSSATIASGRESTRGLVALNGVIKQSTKGMWLFKLSLRIGILAKWFFPDSVMAICEYYCQSQDFNFVWDPGGFMWDPGGVCTRDPSNIYSSKDFTGQL